MTGCQRCPDKRRCTGRCVSTTGEREDPRLSPPEPDTFPYMRQGETIQQAMARVFGGMIDGR